MRKIQKKVCTTLKCIKNFLNLGFTITGFPCIYSFASLVRILKGITSSAIRLKVCSVTAGIKNYKSIINKKKKKHDKIVQLANSKLNSIEVLISKTFIDSVISYDEILFINIVVREYNEMTEEKKFKDLTSL